MSGWWNYYGLTESFNRLTSLASLDQASSTSFDLEALEEPQNPCEANS